MSGYIEEGIMFNGRKVASTADNERGVHFVRLRLGMVRLANQDKGQYLRR